MKDQAFIDRAHELGLGEILTLFASYAVGNGKVGSRPCECNLLPLASAPFAAEGFAHDRGCAVSRLLEQFGNDEAKAHVIAKAELFARWCVRAWEERMSRSYYEVDLARSVMTNREPPSP